MTDETLAFRPEEPAPDPTATVALPPAADLAHTLTGGGTAAPAAPGAAPIVPGFEIRGELGRGGMGVVYLARQLRLNRDVALKMILGGGHAAPAAERRFVAEMEWTAAVPHPGIVQVYESGQHDGLPYFALEYCPGGTLAKKLDGTPLAPRAAAELVERLARAVHAAHEKCIVHRDLKPANVLFGSDGTPKVADFGLARRGGSSSDLTATGAILGTPSYMAPEQASGRALIGPATDVYSLGAILYECLAGRPPFRAATALETVLQVQKEEPVAPSRLVPGLPRDLETICLKCLAKDPAKRYASAAALADDLTRFRDGRPITARPAPAWERAWKGAKRRPALSLSVLFAGAALAAVVAVVLVTNADLQRERDAAARDRDRARLAEEEATTERDKAVLAGKEEFEARLEAADALTSAQTEKKKALERLTLALNVVDKMMLRAAGERWSRRPELREERKKVLVDAVEFFQGLSAEDSRDPHVRRETVRANEAAAGAFVALGDAPAALGHLTRAIALQRALVADAPTDADPHTKLAALLNLLANTQLLLARYGPADKSYKEAVETARRAAALAPDRSEPQITLAVCLAVYGHFITNSAPKDAVKVFDETLAIARQLVARGDTSYPVRQALAMSLTNRAAFESDAGRAADAGRSLVEAEQLLAALVTEPAPNAHAADLLDSIRLQTMATRAQLLARAAKPGEAAAKYREALAVVDVLLANQPSFFPWLYQRFRLLIDTGMQLYNAGQIEESRKVLADLAAAEKALIAAYPQHLWVPGQAAFFRSLHLVERARRGELTDLRQEFDALYKWAPGPAMAVRYNAACAYALASAKMTGPEREAWARAALVELEKARAAGYFTNPRAVDHMDGDADLDPIRARPEYTAFRAPLRALAPPPRPVTAR